MHNCTGTRRRLASSALRALTAHAMVGNAGGNATGTFNNAKVEHKGTVVSIHKTHGIVNATTHMLPTPAPAPDGSSDSNGMALGLGLGLGLGIPALAVAFVVYKRRRTNGANITKPDDANTIKPDGANEDNEDNENLLRPPTMELIF